MIRITYTGSALSMSLPFAGTGLAAVYEFRPFRRRGVDSATAGWALALSGIFSTSSLAVLLMAGAILGGASMGAVAGFAGAVIYLVPGAVVLLALRYERVRAWLGRLFIQLAQGVQRLPQPGRPRPAGGLPGPAGGVPGPDRHLRPPARGYLAVFGLSTLNWAADCTALALAIQATGLPVPWHALLLAYGASAAIGSTGLTPGGSAWSSSGGRRAVRPAAYPARRPGRLPGVPLVNFWLVLAIGWLVMLRRDRPAGP